MEHTAAIHFTEREPEHGSTKEIWRTFWILLILTVVELAFGYWMIGIPHGGKRNAIKAIIIVLMLAKAFYIVAYFMHLKAELKNLIMTILVPLIFLVWGIAAFLYEGNSFRRNKNTFNKHYKESANTPAPKTEEPKHDEKKPGAME